MERRHAPRESVGILHNIEKDGTELTNLADAPPEIVEELSALWHKTATKVERIEYRVLLKFARLPELRV